MVSRKFIGPGVWKKVGGEGVGGKWQNVKKNSLIRSEVLNWDSYLAQLGQVGLSAASPRGVEGFTVVRDEGARVVWRAQDIPDRAQLQNSIETRQRPRQALSKLYLLLTLNALHEFCGGPRSQLRASPLARRRLSLAPSHSVESP